MALLVLSVGPKIEPYIKGMISEREEEFPALSGEGTESDKARDTLI